MQLNEFNQVSKDALKIVLKQCVQIENWAEQIEAQRPFADIGALLDFAKQQTNSWSWQEVSLALANHPRIGEKKARAKLSEIEQTFSKNEQAAIQQDENTQTALLKGNLAYEKKFGHIFLIKAAGLNSEQVLQALNNRLLNDEDTERHIVKQQLGEIALLRLAQGVYE